MTTGLRAIALGLATLAAGADDAATVTCRVEGDSEQRVYVLERDGEAWRLSFRSRETGEHWIRLALPGADPAIGAETVRLSYRNANGGRQVDLVASPSASSLDVWVDYGLDVNIEPDLDPRVDLMTTGGPLADVRCAVGARP
jgi:hypothetical protein